VKSTSELASAEGDSVREGSGPWAASPPKPMAQFNKVFLLLFVHKKKSSSCYGIAGIALH
jgi:hypothetical protein